MDRYELSNEMTKCVHYSKEPISEIKYLTRCLRELYRVYGTRENDEISIVLNSMEGFLRY